MKFKSKMSYSGKKKASYLSKWPSNWQLKSVVKLLNSVWTKFSIGGVQKIKSAYFFSSYRKIPAWRPKYGK